MTASNRATHVPRRFRPRPGPAPGLLRALLLLTLLPLAGCLTTRIRRVSRTVILTNVQDAGLDQLVGGLASRFDAIQTLNATVDITATTGGAHQGAVKEIPTFPGYMFLRKPGDLRVLLLVPFVRSRALDMVTDGRNFKLLIPPRNRAVEGADEVVDAPASDASAPVRTASAVPSRTAPAATAGGAAPAASMPAGLETIRPYIVRDAMLVPAPGPEEILTLTEGSRVLPPAEGKKDSTEEPTYNITMLRHVKGQVYERVRVVHIGRVTLLPYQQDIYDHRGRVVTRVTYDRYQRFGTIDYPALISIARPLDEYNLKIDITKLQVNTKLDDEQFVLKIPDNVPVQKM